MPLRLPAGFLHGEILQARRVRELILAKAEYAPNARVARHTHAHARFDFVLRGTFTETYGHCTRECSSSLLIFRPPGEQHSEIFHPRGAICLSIDVAPRWLEQAREESIQLPDSAEFRGGLLTHLCHRLHHEFQMRDEVAPLAIESIFAGIAVEVSRRHARAAEPHAPRWLAQVRELLHANFRERLTLSGIAASVGVHPVHLARVFRQHYQCTIGDYVRSLRMDFACRQVSLSDLPLCEIALAAGFSDQSHLTRHFRRHTGLTPAEYRLRFRAR
jgi:AraC family transcriptional regulator